MHSTADSRASTSSSRQATLNGSKGVFGQFLSKVLHPSGFQASGAAAAAAAVDNKPAARGLQLVQLHVSSTRQQQRQQQQQVGVSSAHPKPTHTAGSSGASRSLLNLLNPCNSSVSSKQASDSSVSTPVTLVAPQHSTPPTHKRPADVADGAPLNAPGQPQESLGGVFEATGQQVGPGRHLRYQGGGFSAAWRTEYGHFKSRWHPTVLKSVIKAQQLLTTTAEQRASRVFVPMLSTRHSELCCMLTDLNNKVGATNTLDVFVFTLDNKAQAVYNSSPCWNRKFNISVVFMPLDEHWGVEPTSSSSAIHDTHDWVGMPGLFGENYRRMGHWRLTFQFAFADLLGYRYVWQLDDDSFFKSPVNFSMIEYMQKNDLWVAGFRTLTDPHFVTWGLPEITKLFLVGERIAPTGTLFSNHTNPAGLDGLFTVRNDPVRTQHPLEGDSGGWSRAIIWGNCMVMDMDRFWWPREAQKFVELVVQTGYHWRFRWNEQGVMAMLWQMFVPKGKFQFDDLPIDYHHPRKTWGTCADGVNTAVALGH
jgi:hypothetical protein